MRHETTLENTIAAIYDNSTLSRNRTAIDTTIGSHRRGFTILEVYLLTLNKGIIGFHGLSAHASPCHRHRHRDFKSDAKAQPNLAAISAASILSL